MTALRALLIAWLAVASPFTAFAATPTHHCTHMQGNPSRQSIPFGSAARTGESRALHASHLDAAPADPGPAPHAAGTHQVARHAEPAGAEATSNAQPTDCCGGIGACAGHVCGSAANAFIATVAMAAPIEYSHRESYHQPATAHPETGHHPPLLRPPA